MKPKEIYKNLSKDNFPLFLRGDVILTNNHKSLFARLIRFAGRLGGSDPIVNHAEVYLSMGKSFSADRKMCVHGIEQYFKGKHDIYFYRCIELNDEDRDKLVAEAIKKWTGKPYDILGIFWQALDAITGKNYSEKYNTSKLAYCSELVQRLYWKIRRKVSKEAIGSATPDDIRIYVDKSKIWKLIFSLKKKDGKWIVIVSEEGLYLAIKSIL